MGVHRRGIFYLWSERESPEYGCYKKMSDLGRWCREGQLSSPGVPQRDDLF